MSNKNKIGIGAGIAAVLFAGYLMIPCPDRVNCNPNGGQKRVLGTCVSCPP